MSKSRKHARKEVTWPILEEKTERIDTRLVVESPTDSPEVLNNIYIKIFLKKPANLPVQHAREIDNVEMYTSPLVRTFIHFTGIRQKRGRGGTALACRTCHRHATETRSYPF